VLSSAQTDGAAIYRPRLLGLLGLLGRLGLLLPPLELEEAAALPPPALPLPAALSAGTSSAIL
jgi:hypothetical protein